MQDETHRKNLNALVDEIANKIKEDKSLPSTTEIKATREKYSPVISTDAGLLFKAFYRSLEIQPTQNQQSKQPPRLKYHPRLD